MRLLSVVLFFVMSAVPCGAGRPLATEDAYNVGARGLEAEFAFNYLTVGGAGDEYGPTLVGTYGVLRFLDVAAEVPFLFVEAEGDGRTSGFGDVTVRAKVVAYGGEDGGPALAVVPEARLATGDTRKGLGCGANDFGGLVVLSYAAGSLTLHGNVGYAYSVPDEGGGEGKACAALAAELAAFGPVSFAAEFLVDLAREETASAEDKLPMAAGGGVSAAALDNLAFDAGAHVGLGADDDELCATVGATWGVF